MKTNQTIYTNVNSKIGQWLVVADNHGLKYVGLSDAKYAYDIQPDWLENDEHMSEYRTQLERYFAGQLKKFTLPLNPKGTEFQQKVWQGLTDIPYGETWSYKTLAEHIGHPKAVRAVGAANGRNPISIVIPCHRVIGSNGALTGYAGGLEAKKFLLQSESEQQTML